MFLSVGPLRLWLYSLGLCILFAALGENPAEALYVFFIEPLTASWSLQGLVVKATPLILIGVGLAVCYLSNTWNIGGEG